MRPLLTLLAVILTLLHTNAAAKELWLNPQRGFMWNEGEETSGIITNTTGELLVRSVGISAGTAPLSVTTTIRNLHCNPERSYPYHTPRGSRNKASMPEYNILLIGSDTISIGVSADMHGVEPFISLSPRLSVTAPGVDADFIPKGEYKVNQPAIFIIRREGTSLTIEAGTAEAQTQWTGELPEDFAIESAGIAVAPGGAVDVNYLHAEVPESAAGISPSLSLKDIARALETTGDPYAGYWHVTARTTDEKQLRMGGDYTIALVPQSPGFYHLYYVEGATVNPGRWTPGQLKATITRRNHPRYDAVWNDAEGSPMTDATAFFTEDGMLVIRFPYYDDASLTLQRIPASAIPALLPEDTTDP